MNKRQTALDSLFTMGACAATVGFFSITRIRGWTVLIRVTEPHEVTELRNATSADSKTSQAKAAKMAVALLVVMNVVWFILCWALPLET